MKKRLVAIVGGVVCGGALAFAGEPMEMVLQQAQAAYESARYQDALALCRQSLSESGDARVKIRANVLLAYTHVRIAQEQAQLRHDQEAEAAFQSAVNVRPDDELVHYYYGSFLEQRGRAREAMRELETAVSLLQEQIGRVKSETGEESYLRYYGHSVGLLVNLHFDLGRLAYQAGQYAESDRHFRMLLTRWPGTEYEAMASDYLKLIDLTVRMDKAKALVERLASGQSRTADKAVVRR